MEYFVFGDNVKVTSGFFKGCEGVAKGFEPKTGHNNQDQYYVEGYKKIGNVIHLFSEYINASILKKVD